MINRFLLQGTTLGPARQENRGVPGLQGRLAD
jgi:hypothetical protein